MSSLYEISNEILGIFNAIESQDGEVADEQYEALAVKQEELNAKLASYVKAIKEFQKDADFCKAEKKSINDRQNVYKNRVERLKHAALEAVLAFGQDGKANKFVELPDCRLYTKASKSVEIDEERLRIFMAEFERYVRELVGQGILYAGKDVDLQGVLDVINANIRAEQGDGFVPFTLNDLIAIRINVSQTASVRDLFRSGLALNLYGQEPVYTTMQNASQKEDFKKACEYADFSGTPCPTVAKVVVNQTLQIK